MRKFWNHKVPQGTADEKPEIQQEAQASAENKTEKQDKAPWWYTTGNIAFYVVVPLCFARLNWQVYQLGMTTTDYTASVVCFAATMVMGALVIATLFLVGMIKFAEIRIMTQIQRSALDLEQWINGDEDDDSEDTIDSSVDLTKPSSSTEQPG